MKTNKIYEGNLISTYNPETEGFLAPDGVTYSDIPQIGWQIVEKRIPQKTELEIKIEKLEQDWNKLIPSALQSMFRNNYNDIRQALLNNNKEKAIQDMQTLAIFMVTEELKQVHNTLLDKIKEV